MIFGSVFFFKKVIKLIFFLKKLKPNQNWFKSTGFGSVQFFRTKTGSNRFCSVFSVWLGFFLVWLGCFPVWLGFFPGFFGLGSVFRFQACKTETKPNQLVFLNSNRFNQFFFTVQFFRFFFRFSLFNRFFCSPNVDSWDFLT